MRTLAIRVKSAAAASLFLLVSTPLVFSVSACGGTASTVCSLECECEHCNDIKEDFVCAQREAEHDIADGYGCVEQWDEWASCFEDRGVCDEKEVRYSTLQPGSCSADQDTGFPCATSNECAAFGADNCSNGTCRVRACADNGNPCQSDSDCSNGTDLCEVEQTRLRDCQREASDDPRYFSGGFDQGNPEG
jgi:hypothetical protein